MESIKKINITPNVYLDTNAFYEMLNIFGLKSVGGQNDKVNYLLYEKFIKICLEDKMLYIPAYVIFEFTSKYRNDDVQLKAIIDTLDKISKNYSYNLLKRSRTMTLFDLYNVPNEHGKKIIENYYEILKCKEDMLLEKVDSEAEIITLFARSVAYIYLKEFYIENEKTEKSINFWFKTQFFDSIRHIIKNDVAKKLYKAYQNGQENKNLKNIIDSAEKMACYLLNNFSFFPEKSELKKDDFLLNRNKRITEKIHKKYNKEKDFKKITTSVLNLLEDFRTITDFNESQLCYLAYLIRDVFTKNKMREKNDTEDFCGLGCVNGDKSFLLSFDLEVVDIIRQTNQYNYIYLVSFFKDNEEKCKRTIELIKKRKLLII